MIFYNSSQFTNYFNTLEGSTNSMRLLYKVNSNNPKIVTPTKQPKYCIKVSGKGQLCYSIDSNNILTISNVSAPRKSNSKQKIMGTHKKTLNLNLLITSLVPQKSYYSAKSVITKKMLNARSNNNAGFICAILKDIGILDITER